MENEDKKPKEKKEKVVIRKCHHCHKPLDEGKTFCLHCGHTYTEEDPFAAEKKAKRMKRLRKLLVFLGIVAVIALAIFITVTLILKEINKSDFLRITEFIKSEGEFVTGTPPEELEFASELEEASRLEEQKKENEKNSEAETDSESTEESDEVGALSAKSGEEENSESESKTELEPSESEAETDAESEIVEDENKMVSIETLDRYQYKINKNTVICCTEENETTFYIIYTSTVDSFYLKIIVELSEENMDDEYLWSALVSYDDPSPAMSQFDFVRQYYGTFDPARVDYSANFTWIDIANRANDGEDEVVEGETESGSEDESGEENPDGEEGDEEYVDPSLTIDEDIENAALDMVANEIRSLIKTLYDFIAESQIPATLDELGFDKLFAYYESLDPLKNGQIF